MLFQGDGVEADESYALRFLTSAAEKVPYKLRSGGRYKNVQEKDQELIWNVRNVKGLHPGCSSVIAMPWFLVAGVEWGLTMVN